MNPRSILLSCLAIAASLTFITSARADLIGNTITATGTSLSPSTAVVGSGIEFNAIASNWLNFDFAATTLTITLNQDFPASLVHVGWTSYGPFVFSGITDTITSLSIGSNLGFGGSIVNNFSFTDHSITLDMSGGYADRVGNTLITTDKLVFNITTSGSSNVPDSASTFTLLSAAIAGVGLLRRRFAR